MKCSNCGDSNGVIAIDSSTNLCSNCENITVDQTAENDIAPASQQNPTRQSRRPPVRFEDYTDVGTLDMQSKTN